MKPAGTVDYNSLSWVREQLDAVLSEAQVSLSEYIENNEDVSVLSKCADNLQLVYGTLQMVEMYGASMLAEEMQATVKALVNKKIENPAETYDVLMRSMLQLPDYLEGLQAGNIDTPILLLPLINDLRTTRKESLLSENVLFFPNIESVILDEDEEIQKVEPGKLLEEANRLRKHYQVGLLDVLRGQRVNVGLKRMQAVISVLQKTSIDTSIRRFWIILNGFIEGVLDEGIDANISVKMLLGSIDRQIKVLINVGEDRYTENFSQEVLRNILYYIGRSSSKGNLVSKIKDAYKLDELLAGADDGIGTGMGGLNAELFATVSEGIKEDLGQVKDGLELFMHSATKDVSELEPLLSILSKIGDTYTMLGLGATRQVVLDQRDAIKKILSGDIAASEQEVTRIASELLKSEAELNDYINQRSGYVSPDEDDEERIVPASEYREVLATVVKEGLQNFTEAKDAIIKFVTGSSDKNLISVIESRLEEVRGATQMLKLSSVELHLFTLIQYVQVVFKQNQHIPDADEQDTLADVVSSIEYFLEAVAEGRPGLEIGLEKGEEAANKLNDVIQSFDASVIEVELPAESQEEDIELVVDDQEDIELDEEIIEVVDEQTEDAAVEEVSATSEATILSESILNKELMIIGSDADEEILEIFIEEAIEVLEELNKNFPTWKANKEDSEALTILRRSFHTLKGSGRLLGAELIGEFSWHFENILNNIIDNKIEADSVVFSKIEEALSVLPQLIEQLKGNTDPIENINRLMAEAEAVSEGKSLDNIMLPGQYVPVIEQVIDRDQLGKEKNTKSIEIDLEEEPMEVVIDEIIEEEIELDDDSENEDTDAVHIDLSDIDVDIEDSIELSQIDDSLEIEIGDVEIKMNEDGNTEIDIGMDPALFDIYYTETSGHLKVIRDTVEGSKNSDKPLTVTKDLIRSFHTLYGSARTAEIDQIAELCGTMEKYLKAKSDSTEPILSEDTITLISNIEQRVSSMLENVKVGSKPRRAKKLVEQVNLLLKQELQSQLQKTPVKGKPVSNEKKKVVETSTLPEEPDDSNSLISYSDIDDDLIEIFLEEAEELLDSCETCLVFISKDVDDQESIQSLQRYMHTLKGGSRMADLTPIGDLTHVLESLVIKIANKQIETGKTLFSSLHESLDELNAMLVNVRNRAPIPPATKLIHDITTLLNGGVPEKRSVERFDIDIEDLDANESSDDISSLEPVEEFDLSSGKGKVSKTELEPHNRRAADHEKETNKPKWGERASDVNYRDTQEQVRVRADLLNNLVNYAGEVNIYHARMGKQVTDIGFNLEELTQTVIRLKQQLRNLEIETEIQIRSTLTKETDQYGQDFDPLEMDRYSTLHQLSRSLTETASDVQSINDILADITRSSETLLIQESRVSTELQEGLMRTRMVRFGGLSTRLRRIIRQTARELGKEVELDIIGEDTEVDRTVLDRIVAPIEHMLRNAVAHGIETPDVRSKSGKSESGKITITIGRDGVDVVLLVEDNGAGMDPDAIRKKAIKTGLLKKSEKVTDNEVLKFILKTGFSTADEVTQISGRGVGMDVVDSEIKQLGGSLDIETVRGKGSKFLIRLPLTLAINQALMVQAGEYVYAVPLISIEGVVRVTGIELQKFYDSDQNTYEFNNVQFELKHLGKLLTGKQHNYGDELNLFPVLLSHVGDKHYAFHVDDLIGRREVVVKPVGHQIGTVSGISGATILADGRVVLILELATLVVGEREFRSLREDKEIRKTKVTTIMVVDDSITIRKVTARILERNGITVMAAKDGIDATNQLQDTVPDLMLLDIEMPRMDGFELATNIRGDKRLKDIPIIMITSRTGEKHKEKAFSIGVNEYLGKPYQEEELMKSINELLDNTG